MVELREIMFDNVYDILELSPKQNQRRFVQSAAEMIAMAFAGNNEKCPGFLSAIYNDGKPAGIILIGRSEVGKDEIDILRKYGYVYRIWGFFIDKNYQHKGIGKTSLKLAFEKLKEYPDAERLPLYLECKKENKIALLLYESFGFINTRVLLGDDYVLIRLPEQK